jgi:hypothetical protein
MPHQQTRDHAQVSYVTLMLRILGSTTPIRLAIKNVENIAPRDRLFSASAVFYLQCSGAPPPLTGGLPDQMWEMIDLVETPEAFEAAAQGPIAKLVTDLT